MLTAGCASTSNEMHEAQEHQQRADRAAAEGDYHKAAREQDKANEHSARANAAATYRP
jgi:hypothetical protein